MKLGFYLEASKFLSKDYTYLELIDFLIYLKNKYYPYKSVENIFSIIFSDDEKIEDDIPEEYRHFLYLDIEILEGLREDYSRAGEWKLAEIIAKIIERKRPTKLHNSIEKHVFLVHSYLSRISNITLDEVLQLEEDVIYQLLNDKNLQKYAQNRLL